MIQFLTVLYGSSLTMRTCTSSAKEELSLRELVERIGQLAGGSLNIEFGGRPYRVREVMKPWDEGCNLPGWQCRVSLADGLKELFC